MPTVKRPRIFISYAHEDSGWMEHLTAHLGGLANTGQIEVFDDRKLGAGEEWDRRLKEELEAANIVVLVITKNFLASKYATSVEMQQAMAQRDEGSTCVIPVLFERCYWESIEALPLLNLVPKDDRQDLTPVKVWKDQDDALTRVARAIGREVARLSAHAQPGTVAPKIESTAAGATGRALEERTHEFSQSIAAAVAAADPERAGELSKSLGRLLTSSPDLLPEGPVVEALAAISRLRRAQLVLDLAEAALQAGQEAPAIRGYYARALVDGGAHEAARAVLRDALAAVAEGSEEAAELQRELAYVNKVLFLAASNPQNPAAKQRLAEALHTYLATYRASSDATSGAYAAAVLLRARHDGIELDGPSPLGLAGEVLDVASQRIAGSQHTPRDLAAALEASIVLGNFEAATELLHDYTSESGIDPSAMRELGWEIREMWLDREPRVAGLAETIDARLAELEGGGRINIDAPTIAGKERWIAGLETVLGQSGMSSVTWFERMLDTRLSVARVEDDAEQARGTAFVLDGGDLSPALAGERVVLTPSYVVSDQPAMRSTLAVAEAQLNFTGLDRHVRTGVDAVLFESPISELGVSVLRVASLPDEVPPLRAAGALPVADGDQRVYLVGHPRGGHMKFAIDDNVLLDHDGTRVHYRAPTEPGSSGSPVLDRNVEVVAMHSRGSDQMPRLHGRPGTYQAKEGIAIRAIAAAMTAVGGQA